MPALLAVLQVRGGPRYHSTLGARSVRYDTTTAVVPRRHSRLPDRAAARGAEAEGHPGHDSAYWDAHIAQYLGF